MGTKIRIDNMVLGFYTWWSWTPEELCAQRYHIRVELEEGESMFPLNIALDREQLKNVIQYLSAWIEGVTL